MALLLDRVLALSQGVPQLDGLVPGAADDLTVVGGKGHAHDIASMVLEPPGGAASRQIPQTEVLVPRSGQSKVAVGGENDVGDEVTMSVETLLGNSVLIIAGDLPHNQSFVSGRTQDHVGVLGVGRDLGDPATVSLEGSAELEGFCHRKLKSEAVFSQKK